MALQDTDNLIVQRDSNLNKVQIQNMASIQDTDLLVIGRGSDAYKISGKDFMESVKPDEPDRAPSIGAAVLTGPSNFSDGTFTTTLTSYDPGNPEAQQSLKAKVVGPFAAVGETSPITGIISGADGNIAPLDDTGARINADVSSILAAMRVTQITGMGLDKRSSDQYTVELQTFKVNGVQITATNIVTTEGTNYSSDSWQNWLVNPQIAASVQGQGGTTYSCTFDPIDVEGSTVTIDTGSIGAIYVLDEYGDKVYIVGGSNYYKRGPELNLTDRTNLDNGLFQPGDVVKESGTPPTQLVYAQANDEDKGAYFNYFDVAAFKTSNWLITDYIDETIIGTTFTFSYFYSEDGVNWTKKGNYNSTSSPGVTPGSDDAFGMVTIYGQPGVGEAKISLTGVEYKGTVGTLPNDNPFGEQHTVVSIDPVDPSMLVSGGTWSIGETVKNTVTRFPTIIPESDEVVGADTQQSRDYSGGTVDNPPLGGYGWDNAFNGVLSGLGAQSNGLIGSGSESTLTISPAVSGNKIELLVAGDATGPSYTAGHTACINGTALIPDNSTAVFTSEDNLTRFELTGTTSLNSITAGDQNLVGVSVDGLLLVDDQAFTQLTFASSDGLINFKDGDNVVQSGNGYTPITSVITGVTETVLQWQSTMTRGYTFTEDDTVATKSGSGYGYIGLLESQGSIARGETKTFRFQEQQRSTYTFTTVSGFPSSGNGRGAMDGPGYGFRMNNSSINWYLNGALLVSDSPAPLAEPNDTITITVSRTPDSLNGKQTWVVERLLAGDTQTYTFDDADPNPVFMAYSHNNGITSCRVLGSTVVELTDDKDLENFRAGDVLGGFENPTGSFPQGDVFYRLSPGYTDYNEFTNDDFEVKEGISVSKQSKRGNDYGTRQYQVDLDNELNTDGLNEMFVECWFYKPTPAGTYAFRGNVSPFNFYGAGGIASTVVGGYISSGTFFPWFKGSGGTVHQRGPISTGTAFADIGEGWYHLAWYFDANGNNGIYLNGTRVGGEINLGVAPDHSTRPVKGWSNTYASNAGYCPDSNLACIRFSQGNPYGRTYDQPFTPLPIDSDQWTTQSSVVKMFLPLAGGDQTTITAVGPGNTLTLNKDSYSVGDVIVGPKIEPATGIVSGQPADSKMNLGTTDGRWITNGGLTVVGPPGPATYVESYLTWDNYNMVTGIVSVDPGFAPVDNLVLTFPTNAPTGESWDDELPAGTFMQTRVQASNTVATVDSGYSAMYTPRTASAVDYNSDREYAEVALRLKTFTNRKHVYCAQQVEAQRDQAIQALAAEGYELSDILKYL